MDKIISIKEEQTPRGYGVCLQLGWFRKYSNNPYFTKLSSHPIVWWWILENENLWTLASNYARKYYPKQAAQLDRIDAPFKVGLWTTVQWNMNWATDKHKDKSDAKKSLTAVIILGDCKGGEFCFTDELLYIPVENNCSLVLFIGSEHLHHVNNFVGWRSSFTLYS